MCDYIICKVEGKAMFKNMKYANKFWSRAKLY